MFSAGWVWWLVDKAGWGSEMVVADDDMDEGWRRDTNKGTDKKECVGGVDNDKMGKMGEGTARNE
jgi:hypothetical protein